MSNGTIELGEVTYLVSEPTPSDIFTWIRFCRKQARDKWNPLKNILEGMTAEQQAFTIRESLSASLPDDLLIDVQHSPEGIAFITWLLIRKNHQEVTFEFVKNFVTDENVVEKEEELDAASGLYDAE